MPSSVKKKEREREREKNKNNTDVCLLNLGYSEKNMIHLRNLKHYGA